VLYVALQAGCCSPPIGFPSLIRATLLRRWVKLRGLFEQFFEFFTQQLFQWIQFVEPCVEHSLVGQFYFLKQSQFRRVCFAQFQYRISGVAVERALCPLWRGRCDP
jgi:hypothetical protein